MLAVFANLGIIKTTSLSGQVKTAAVQQELWVPPTAAFRLGPSFDPDRGLRLTVRLGASVPPTLAGQPLEWAYRWLSDEQLVIVRLMWRHTRVSPYLLRAIAPGRAPVARR